MGAPNSRMSGTRGAASPGSVGEVETQYLDLTEPIQLTCGRSLFPVRIAYETYGHLNAERDNTILICHALSGDAHAAGISRDRSSISAVDGYGASSRDARGLGWWDGMIGPGKAFDTDRYFVICTNLIGGCGGSTGPSSVDPDTGAPYGSRFPVVTVEDMVRAQRAALEILGVERLACVAGASLGGMQALEWAVSYPESVDTIVAIASTARISPQGLAWNAIARESIMSDPKWNGGDYYTHGASPRAGMGIGRMVGHVTYLSAESMAEKFGRRLQDRAARSYELTSADYQVESYLRYQAQKFVQRFDANSYLLISRALTYFDLADHGNGDLEQAVAGVRAASLLISFSSDWLYPPGDSASIQQAMESQNKTVCHVRIEAPYGHDSFLLEEDRQTPLIRQFIEENRGTSKP